MRLIFLAALFFLISSCGDKVKKVAPVKPKDVKINLKLIKSITTKKLLSLVRKQSNILLITGFAGNISIRDSDSWKILRTVKYSKGRVVDFVLGLFGEAVLFVDGFGRLKGFNLKNGIFLNIGDDLSQLSVIASHPLKNKIVVGDRQGSLIFLDEQLKKFTTKKTSLKKIKSLRFSPDGEFLLAAGLKKDILIFKTADGSLIKKIKTTGPVTSFAFSKDKKYLSVGTIFWKVAIYQIKDWKEIIVKEINLEPVIALAFSEDSRRLYVGYGRSGKGEIAIFYGTNFVKEKIVPLKDSGVIFLYSHQKKVLAVTTEGNFKLWVPLKTRL